MSLFTKASDLADNLLANIFQRGLFSAKFDIYAKFQTLTGDNKFKHKLLTL